MARYVTAYNPTDRPVVIDDEGRTVAGRSWAPVIRQAEEVRGAYERGDLVTVSRPADDDELDPQAVEAFDATDELNEADGPEELAEVAEDTGATPTKAARKAAARTQEAKAR